MLVLQHLFRFNSHRTIKGSRVRRSPEMLIAPRPQCRLTFAGFVLALFLLSMPAWAAEKLHFHADDYQIDAVLSPHDHKLTARAKVKITALEDLNIVSFHLHNDLRLSK